MSRVILIDAVAWVALADKSETHHKAALATYRKLLQQRYRLITTNLIVAEGYALIRTRFGHTAAMRFLADMHETAQLEVIYSTPKLTTAAEGLLRQYKDQDFSLADAVSFALMRERNITHAFTFDHHFTVARFIIVPGAI